MYVVARTVFYNNNNNNDNDEKKQNRTLCTRVRRARRPCDNGITSRFDVISPPPPQLSHVRGRRITTPRTVGTRGRALVFLYVHVYVPQSSLYYICTYTYTYIL